MALGNRLLPAGDPAQHAATGNHAAFGKIERRMAVGAGSQELPRKLIEAYRRGSMLT